MLHSMFEAQLRQQAKWHDWTRLTDVERVALVKDLLLGLHKQTADFHKLLDRSQYHILAEPPPLPVDDVSEAGIDILKYLLALLALHNVTPEMLVDAFWRKTAVVDDRWNGEQLELAAHTEVVLCDLDGCAADWAVGFRTFANQRQRYIAPGHLNDPGLEALKDEFDGSGGFSTLAVLPGAIETLAAVRKAGKKLVVVTARPVKRFKRVYADTLLWCQSVGLVYDRIIFTRDKAEAVRMMAPARVVGFIEDRTKHALEVAQMGATVYKLPSEEGGTVEHPNIIPVPDWATIASKLL